MLNDEFKLGFISPGHGSKGRQISLQSNSDLEKMYEEHKSRKEVVLWLKVVKSKRKRPLSNSTVVNTESKTKKHATSEQGSSSGSNYQGHIRIFLIFDS